MRKPARIVSAPRTDALPLHRCLAKSRRLEDGRTVAGRTMEEHCRIVGAVARELLARMPDCVRRLFPPHADIPAQTHDVGKIWSHFQYRLYQAVGLSPENVPELRGLDLMQDAGPHGHAAVGMAALKAMGAPAAVAEIVGQHHGLSSVERDADCGLYGGPAWLERRLELLGRLLGPQPDWPVPPDAETVRLVAGLTIVADWIGSGPHFDDPAPDWRPLTARAVDEAGFASWTVRPGLDFGDVFGFAPRPAQRALYERVTGPGVYVLEAPMGQGKTEAALYAAYRLLESGQSAGIYFALPTQLTSNRIHTRLDAFLDRVLLSGDGALLLHGKAWLEHFLRRQTLGADAAPEGSWFARGKRGILAPFAAGTVDQALMAAMHVRHGALRAFGLAGKTVILDEVHSYDTYTGTILDNLVDLLRHAGCTVIILSATLTARRRADITGLASSTPDYPLITACPNAGPAGEYRPDEESSPAHDVPPVLLDHPDDARAVEEALLRAEQGQRVLWIENTVADAQERYRLLAARASGMGGVDVGLLHSRYTPADRSRNEDLWTARYAPDAEGRGKTGCLLVGTQVLEQSLDLDADFLITRFCPTDMLLQRLGRLWRHAVTSRPAGARREAWLLHPPLVEALKTPDRAFAGTGRVYAPYVLCRSLELWHTLDAIALPGDVRHLLEQTYAEREEETPPLMRAKHDMERERETLRGMALRGLSTDGSTLPDVEAGTRAGQRPEVDVLLLRARDAAGRRLITADGTVLNLSPGASWEQRQAIAAGLALNVVRVPERAAPPATTAAALAWLEPWYHCVDRHSGRVTLRVALVDDDGALRRLDGNPAGDGFLHYSDKYGYKGK